MRPLLAVRSHAVLRSLAPDSGGTDWPRLPLTVWRHRSDVRDRDVPADVRLRSAAARSRGGAHSPRSGIHAMGDSRLVDRIQRSASGGGSRGDASATAQNMRPVFQNSASGASPKASRRRRCGSNWARRSKKAGCILNRGQSPADVRAADAANCAAVRFQDDRVSVTFPPAIARRAAFDPASRNRTSSASSAHRQIRAGTTRKGRRDGRSVFGSCVSMAPRLNWSRADGSSEATNSDHGNRRVESDVYHRAHRVHRDKPQDFPR